MGIGILLDINWKGLVLVVNCCLIWNNGNFIVGLMKFNYNYGILGGILSIIL